MLNFKDLSVCPATLLGYFLKLRWQDDFRPEVVLVQVQLEGVAVSIV